MTNRESWDDLPSPAEAYFDPNRSTIARDSVQQRDTIDVSIIKSLESTSGYLMKLGDKGIVKLWKRRWFRITGDVILYFNSQEVLFS